MGKIILCCGKTAKKPYRFRRTGIRIYSVEELCYYVAHNLETIADEIFAEDLADFMEEELGLSERAQRFRELLHSQSGLKDVAVCILCSADYYTEEEIKSILRQIDEINALTPIQRRKRRADNYLKCGNVKEAAGEYGNILSSRESAGLSAGEYADVLHNLAVITMRNDRFIQAAYYFREAYERNQNKNSLNCYLYALALAGEREKCMQEAKFYGMEDMEITELFLELKRLSSEAETSSDWYDLEEIRKRKDQGDPEFQAAFRELVFRMKEDYRRDSRMERG